MRLASRGVITCHWQLVIRNFLKHRSFAIESATDVLLTPREREVLALAKEGMFSKEISEKLNISVHTVNRHRQNILEKLQVDNMIEAIK